MEIVNGFLLGISSGFNCLLSCTPYLVPFFLAEERDFKKNIIMVLKYLAGRLFAYIALAVISAIIGITLKEVKISEKIYSLFFIISSILLFLFVSGKNIHFFLFKKIKSVTSQLPFVVGFFNGLNFCPPLIIAFSIGITVGDIIKSILFFTFFFIGTSFYMLPFVFSGFLTKFESIKNAGKIAGFLVSIWFFLYGIILLFK